MAKYKGQNWHVSRAGHCRCAMVERCLFKNAPVMRYIVLLLLAFTGTFEQTINVYLFYISSYPWDFDFRKPGK